MTIINKDLQVVDKTLFFSKLDTLLTKLRVEYQAGTYDTRDDVLEEFQRAISEFYLNVSTPSLQLRPAIENTSPNYEHWNKCFSELGYDLVTIFKQLGSLEQFVLGNFNFMVSERDKISQVVRRIASKVNDYALYSEDPNQKLLYFKDSFNDLTKIDFASTLLKEKQADINTIEGIVTLPVVKSNLGTPKAMQVQINANSGPGGSVGNYQELNAAPHDDIRDILDGNPDTWFEYERVQGTREENTVPLVLDLTLYFDQPEIVNFIRINPNNFGTQTQLEILEIETSLDGQTLISIKDDIPIAGFLQEDEENVFTLAPSTSKFAGQGLYTFTPRKAKYVHLILRQSTPYLIQTNSGIRWRYAIGLRDIEVQGIKYETIGEIISQPFESTQEIQKVTLLASENPAEQSELADIRHQISVDNGATWHDIQPQDRNVVGIPEILSFNTDDADSISTEHTVYSLRHKMVLKRDPAQFKEGAATLSEIEYDVSDVLVLPRISPILLSLTRTPIEGSIRIMNPLWGSRALDGMYLQDTTSDGRATTTPAVHAIGRSNGQPDQVFRGILSREINSGKVSIWKDKETNTDYNELVIWVDGDSSWTRVGESSWTRVGEFTSSQNYKEYIITNDGTLIFGDYDTVASSGAGRIPSAGSVIGFTLKEERLVLSATKPFSCDLIFPTDGDKDHIKIYRYDEPTTPDKTIPLKPGSKVIRLPHKNIIEDTVVVTGTDYYNVFNPNDEVTFVDGSSELTTDKWSVDYSNGVIYSYDSVPATASDWRVTYTYQPIVELQNTDWDFIIDSAKQYNRIKIYDTGYGYRNVTGQLLVENSRMVQLLLSDNTPARSVIPSSIIPSQDSPFTSNVLPIEVKFIDGETEFYVVGTDVQTQGWYSVDYRNGIIYIAPTDSFASGRTVSFQYTHFVMCYNIAQYLPTTSFSVNLTSKLITVNEREALKLWYGRDLDIKRDDLLKVIYDCVKTTRDSIEELEPYFSPIVRHFIIKASPKEFV